MYPTEDVPTLKVKPSHESQGAFVVINESDFDPEKHELFEEPKTRKRKQSDGAGN